MNNKQETIERYLRQEMDGKELQNFTFQMVMDPSLRKEIEQTRKIFKTLRTHPNPSVKQGNNWLLIGLLAIVTIGGAYLFYANFIQDKAEESQRSEERPIAQSDPFQPNLYFEDLTTRQMDFVINIENEINAVFTIEKNSPFNFKIKAALLGKNIPNKLNLSIWSNSFEKFEADQPVFSEILEISNNNQLRFQTELNISEGLYYYIFTTSKTDEPIKSGKFILQNT
ncbi:MAG: hypothetical protein NXI23_00405 [Bacteroidetes bacterium]|jgi:hypothetical protein|nr:hypothetical protein [Bacteroidota bacterium]MDF1867029.1 hypothetical protein [Saprospiraceae bacterium]